MRESPQRTIVAVAVVESTGSGSYTRAKHVLHLMFVLSWARAPNNDTDNVTTRNTGVRNRNTSKNNTMQYMQAQFLNTIFLSLVFSFALLAQSCTLACFVCSFTLAR